MVAPWRCRARLERRALAPPCCSAALPAAGPFRRGRGEPSQSGHRSCRYLPGAPAPDAICCSAAAACGLPLVSVWPPVHGWTNAAARPALSELCVRLRSSFPMASADSLRVAPHSPVARPEVTESSYSTRSHQSAHRTRQSCASASRLHLHSERSTHAAELGRS